MTSRPRDKGGVVIFYYYRRPGDPGLQATDAKLIGHIDSTYISATNRDPFSSNVRGNEKLVITTPNADYLPAVHVGNQTLALRVDGRWGANDWSQWPQWYFGEQDHFPYILRRPSPTELPNHPLRLLWWNMEERHFRPDEGLNAGRLISSITDGFYDIRTQLTQEVLACVCSNGKVQRKLALAASKMRAYTSALRHTPQPFRGVLQTVAAAQRYCLETRAILDKITKWDPMKPTSGERPTDTTILGSVTDSKSVAYLMQQKGVPVWFVRTLAQLPDDVNILEERPVLRPSHFGIELTPLYEGHNFYVGPISSVLFEAIENWKPGSLDFRLLGKGIPLEPADPTLAAHHTPAGTSRRVEKSQVGTSYYAGNTGPMRSKGASNMVRESALPYSTSGVVFKGLTISLNMELFKASSSLQMPMLLGPWRDALASIKPDLALIVDHPDLLTFRGFAFPPSHLFCGETEVINLERMLVWVMIRTGWMGLFADPSHCDTPLPNPQNWRDYFHDVAMRFEFTRPDNRLRATSDSTAASTASQKAKKPKLSAVRRAKAQKVAQDIFTIQIPPRESLRSLTWHGHTVWRPGQVDFPVFFRKSLLWDIQEHNFRLELLTLDRCLLPAIWKTAEGSANRDQKFTALWPDDVVLMEQLPASTSGISAEDWQIRAPFVEAFRQIVVDWPGEVPQQLSNLTFGATVNGHLVWNQAGMERVEGLIAQHFCQTFFRYFARPPSVPHILPIA